VLFGTKFFCFSTKPFSLGSGCEENRLLDKQAVWQGGARRQRHGGCWRAPARLEGGARRWPARSSSAAARGVRRHGGCWRAPARLEGGARWWPASSSSAAARGVRRHGGCWRAPAARRLLPMENRCRLRRIEPDCRFCVARVRVCWGKSHDCVGSALGICPCESGRSRKPRMWIGSELACSYSP
jgi:hypothetical protein